MSLSAIGQSDPLSGRMTCTVREGCEASGLSVMTLYRAMYRKELVTKKVGRRRLILVSSLRELVGADEQAGA